MINDRSVSILSEGNGGSKNDSACDVTTNKVDLRLSTLKLFHVKVMTNLYQYLSPRKGKTIIKAGWETVG